MHKTEKITPAQDNPQRVKEPVQAGSKKETDKPFCFVLDDVIRKTYPNSREYEKEVITCPEKSSLQARAHL